MRIQANVLAALLAFQYVSSLIQRLLVIVSEFHLFDNFLNVKLFKDLVSPLFNNFPVKIIIYMYWGADFISTCIIKQFSDFFYGWSNPKNIIEFTNLST